MPIYLYICRKKSSNGLLCNKFYNRIGREGVKVP